MEEDFAGSCLPYIETRLYLRYTRLYLKYMWSGFLMGRKEVYVTRAEGTETHRRAHSAHLRRQEHAYHGASNALKMYISPVLKKLRRMEECFARIYRDRSTSVTWCQIP